MSNGRFAIFLATVMGIWAVLHLYVFWRVASVPWVASHVSRRALIILGVGLWASYPLVRTLSSLNLHSIVWPVEMVAANWLGMLFLLFSVLLIVDVVTLGGWPIPETASKARTWALLGGVTLSFFGMAQGIRPPVIREYEVDLAGLPPERDGLVLVEISDVHLNGSIRKGWMEGVVATVNKLKPDIVVAVGDIVDGEADRIQPLVPILKKLQAPLGVWAVTGNHEFYAGLDRSVGLLEQAGYTVLRDRWAQAAPGLTIAGVDDLGARRQYGLNDHPVQTALSNHPAGGVVYLCHTPEQAETAAASGAGLMLSGHTHDGQVWPFTYLVQMRYPLLAGRYEVNGMPVIVCRGTGTWGPRMRLWQPSEILSIKLRSPGKKQTATSDKNEAAPARSKIVEKNFI